MSMIRQGVYLAWDLERPRTRQPNPGPPKPSAVHETSTNPQSPAPSPPHSSHPATYSREGRCSEAEDGDQAQAHAGLIPAILGTFTKHIPDPLDRAIGADGEVAGTHCPPDHGCRGRVSAGKKEQVCERRREGQRLAKVCSTQREKEVFSLGRSIPSHSPVTGSYWSCPLHSGDNKRPDFIQLLCQLNEFVCGVGGPTGQQHPLMQLVNI